MSTQKQGSNSSVGFGCRAADFHMHRVNKLSNQLKLKKNRPFSFRLVFNISLLSFRAVIIIQQDFDQARKIKRLKNIACFFYVLLATVC